MSTAEPAVMTYAEPADLGLVRQFVCATAVGLGLPRQRADLLTVAVSELATNTLQHTGDGGRVRVWAEPGRICCEVTDRGRAQRFGRAMPSPEQPRGRGLAIVERICDEVGVTEGPDGTTVRICLLN
jgi:anti-sigma regulatory factor (Ser/Thr protein kinase)